MIPDALAARRFREKEMTFWIITAVIRAMKAKREIEAIRKEPLGIVNK